MEAILHQAVCFILLHFKVKQKLTYFLLLCTLIHYYNIDHGSKSMPLSIFRARFLVDEIDFRVFLILKVSNRNF